MYVLFNLKFLSYTTILLTIYLQKTKADQKGPGESSCSIVSLYYCNDELISQDAFPDKCTSFIFSCLTIDKNHVISYCFEGENNKYLDTLGKTGKKLFVNIGHDDYTAWTKMLDCDGTNAMKDANAIKSFTTEHTGITGLLLRNLEPDVNDTKEFVGYTESVMKYIEVVKQNTGLEVGFSFHADDFQLYYDKPPMAWLNFTVIDTCVDYYVFSLISFFNECSASSAGRSDGVISIDGDYTFTLEKLKGAIEKSLIPTEKIYFNLVVGPQAMDETICDGTSQAMCECPNKAKDWCIDTQETLFKKGQWFRQHGAGFVGGYIDLDDPQGVCNCGKYPSFHAILAGFNRTASVPACPLFDRTG